MLKEVVMQAAASHHLALVVAMAMAALCQGGILRAAANGDLNRGETIVSTLAMAGFLALVAI